VRENKNGAGFILVSGRHRTEAFRLLGHPTIPAFVMPASTTEAEARMLEISENLHRVELTVQERSDQIAEWIKLAKEKREVSRQVAAKPQGGRPESGTRAATRDLGIEDREARRAVKIASIIPAAKEAARAAGSKHESHECASVLEMFLDVVSEKDVEAAAGFLSDVKDTIREKKEASEKSKRLKREAKHPDKAREKARDEAIRAAMDSDMEDAKQEAKENEERWGDVKDEWMEQWEADNWGTEEEAEFEADFRRVWKSDHGTDFPEPQVHAQQDFDCRKAEAS
jgi:ParB-like chromosome segregation protein Spo0J